MSNDQVIENPHARMAVAIGHVCMQWSLLELLMLGVLANLEDKSLEEIELRFAHLDFRPRLNMAIAISEELCCPRDVRNGLIGLRKRMDDQKVQYRRNQVVHGAQKDTDGADTALFHMSRLKGAAKLSGLSAVEVNQIANDISDAGREVQAVMGQIAAWKEIQAE